MSTISSFQVTLKAAKLMWVYSQVVFHLGEKKQLCLQHYLKRRYVLLGIMLFISNMAERLQALENYRVYQSAVYQNIYSSSRVQEMFLVVAPFLVLCLTYSVPSKYQLLFSNHPSPLQIPFSFQILLILTWKYLEYLSQSIKYFNLSFLFLVMHYQIASPTQWHKQQFMIRHYFVNQKFTQELAGWFFHSTWTCSGIQLTCSGGYKMALLTCLIDLQPLHAMQLDFLQGN